MRRLADAGVPVGISLAPVIPGLNDSDIPDLLERARDAGATNAFLTMLRLPAEVLPVFRERLAAAYPDRAAKVWSQIREVRGGRENDARIGRRMSGEGPRWRAIEDLFRLTCRRLGMSTGGWCDGLAARPRTAGRQGTLFGGTSV
jgi:DNA repair photolyase